MIEHVYHRIKKYFRKFLKWEKDNLLNILVYIFITSLIVSYAFYYAEKDANDAINTYFDSLWWTIITFLGYDDFSPQTVTGKVLAVVSMFIGIVFIGSFLATVASIIIQRRTKEMKGLVVIKQKNHLIICGYNTIKVSSFIEEFRSDSTFEDVPIVLVSNSIDAHPFPDRDNIYFVKGDYTNEEVLLLAGIKTASRAIIIAESNQDSSSDEKSILTLLIVKDLNPDIYTCTEVFDPHKKAFFHRAKCDEVISTSEMSVKMMVQALQDPGISHVLDELISNSYGQQFHRSKVPDQFISESFFDFLIAMAKDEYLVFALERNREYLVNPKNDTIIEDGDYYFYISKNRHEL